MIKAVVISGPSGVGKTTLIRKLLSDDELREKLMFSVSCTTRERRPGEIDGKDYHFISRADFENMVAREEMLEWAEVHGNLYGTPKVNIERALEEGKILILDIDVKGAKTVREKLGKDCLLIFVRPPTQDELKKRLIARRDTKDVDTRLKRAEEEMKESHIFDHVIVNDVLESAFNELKRIIKNILILQDGS